MESDLRIALRAAAAAAEVLRDFAQRPLANVDSKRSAGDLVSDADRCAEAVIRSVISAACPDDAIWGEEEGQSAGVSGRMWIVDPLDGTANWIRGIPHWAVSIALRHGDVDLCAVVYDVPRDELFAWSPERGPTLNDQPLPGRRYIAESLDSALVVGSWPYRRLRGQLGQVRNYGAAAIDVCWVAIGRCDMVFFETRGLAEYDIAAGAAIARSVGMHAGWLPPTEKTLPRRFIAGPDPLHDTFCTLTEQPADTPPDIQ